MVVLTKDPSVYIVVMDERCSEVITISPNAVATVLNGWANHSGDFENDPFMFQDEEHAARQGYFRAVQRTYTMIDAYGSEMSRRWADE